MEKIGRVKFHKQLELPNMKAFNKAFITTSQKLGWATKILLILLTVVVFLYWLKYKYEATSSKIWAHDLTTSGSMIWGMIEEEYWRMLHHDRLNP